MEVLESLDKFMADAPELRRDNFGTDSMGVPLVNQGKDQKGMDFVFFLFSFSFFFVANSF